MKRQLIVISGVSGAGKSTASMFLEDLGYLCIDQYPAELLQDLVELLEYSDSPKYEKVALTVSLGDLERFHDLLSNISLKPILIILDANEETLINRYKFTRRVHPLMVSNVANTLNEAIEIEKSIVEKYRNRDCHIIDTTTLSVKQHRDRIEKIIGGEVIKNLGISFVSFGFKHGVPSDGDIVLDVRILDNPFYDEKLRHQTGMDAPVMEFVLNNKKTQAYLLELVRYLDFTFKTYDSIEERRHLTVCVGCTGGQHRSVSVANFLYEYYKDKYTCYITHRELNKL